jgi:hypothetical protein
MNHQTFSSVLQAMPDVLAYFMALVIILFSAVALVLSGGRLYEIYLDSKQSKGFKQ